MNQLMRIAFVALLATSSVGYANGVKHKKATQQHCPGNCSKSQCNKSTCYDMACCSKAKGK